jgi:hypothetical protein
MHKLYELNRVSEAKHYDEQPKIDPPENVHRLILHPELAVSASCKTTGPALPFHKFRTRPPYMIASRLELFN